jgi:hypothetical protein
MTKTVCDVNTKIRITPNIKFAIVSMLFFAVIIALHADTITVTNTNDSGPGSLRQALADATDGDTIDFAVTGTIGLTSGELLVEKNITVSGPGPDNLAVNGNTKSRVFHIAKGQTVVISGLTIINGNVPVGDADGGGGIYNDHGTLTVNSCTMSGNSGPNGGAICNDGVFGSASLHVDNSILANNSSFQGGGIFSNGYSGSVTSLIYNSTLSGNSTQSGDGGGIYSSGEQGGTAILQISNSTISGNSSDLFGGGIYNDGFSGNAALQLSNSTVSGNTTGGVGVGGGGGVYNDGSYGNATAQLSNTTLSGNSSQFLGGAIYNYGSSGTAICEIGNMILHSGAQGENISNQSGTISSLGYNISSDNGGGFLNGPGDQINTDPLLGPLQDNGGLTFTHALLPGSPAIDAGNPSFTPPPLYDQRGPDFFRVRNGRIDIGSFEVQAGSTPTPSPTPTPSATPTPSPTSTPTATPRVTPRPRPTPHTRPTPP